MPFIFKYRFKKKYNFAVKSEEICRRSFYRDWFSIKLIKWSYFYWIRFKIFSLSLIVKSETADINLLSKFHQRVSPRRPLVLRVLGVHVKTLRNIKGSNHRMHKITIRSNIQLVIFRFSLPSGFNRYIFDKLKNFRPLEPQQPQQCCPCNVGPPGYAIILISCMLRHWDKFRYFVGCQEIEFIWLKDKLLAV